MPDEGRLRVDPEPLFRFGVSGLPPDDADPGLFCRRLASQGHHAYELAFVQGFPWDERRCREFGRAAQEAGLWLSVHAPYFAVLTVPEEDRARRCLAAVEHTMKLAAAMGARLVCVHPGAIGERDPQTVTDLVETRLEYLAPKVQDLEVGLGLETAGREGQFGTLGDIALLASRFGFVRPVVDWAHIHARTGGGLTSVEAFQAVFGFLQESFPAWMLDPLHTQFTDNQVGRRGEVRHVAYGEGTLRVAPLVEAAARSGVRLVLISEAREEDSHRAIHQEVLATLDRLPSPEGRSLASGRRRIPGGVRIVPQAERWKVEGTRVPLTISNPDKPLFEDGTTKGDLIAYYGAIAPVLLPHLTDRPLSLARYPDGIHGEHFYEKRAPRHRPKWVHTVAVDTSDGTIDFVTADRRETLMWLANLACIEMHPFHSRRGSLNRPDWAIFDLDPAEGAEWEQVVVAAKLLETALTRLGLRSYPKLSGGRGMHVYVPLDPVYDFRRVRRFVEAVGRLLVAADPEDLTMEWEVDKRRGKVFIDHNRNAFGQTIASVYSVRPRPGAPVSAPLAWSEVGSVRRVTMDDIWDRLRRHGDLFRGVLGGGQRLEEAEAALGIGPPTGTSAA